ncbi:hypothetical protein AAG906_020182 [Vitis piasezkii]
MTDFITKLPKKQTHSIDCPKEQWWTLHVDGVSWVELMEQTIRLSFSTSNNETKYEVMLAELDLALMLVVAKFKVRSDSQLIVRQIQQEYEAKVERMARYLSMVEERLKKLDEWIIRQVPQEENGKADALAGIVATLLIHVMIMLPIYLKVAPSITLGLVCNTSQTNSRWMLNIIKYLHTRGCTKRQETSTQTQHTNNTLHFN